MIIAAAQFMPTIVTPENMRIHDRLIALAAQHKVDLLVFPEMSLTGYERERAGEMAIAGDDPALDHFMMLANFHRMIIVTGAPIRVNGSLRIGSFIFLPDKGVEVYTKQFLHPGEEPFFEPDAGFNPLILHDNKKIAFAICADIAHPGHACAAFANGASIYAASLFYTPEGLEEAFRQLGHYAGKYAMNVVMANYTGKSYNIQAGGRSAFWNHNGELIGQMPADAEGLLVVEHGEARVICL